MKDIFLPSYLIENVADEDVEKLNEILTKYNRKVRFFTEKDRKFDKWAKRIGWFIIALMIFLLYISQYISK